MKLIEETETYKIIEFNDEDLDADKDLNIINGCIFNDIKYEFVNEHETQIKIWRN